MAEQRYVLRLFVTGGTVRSEQAIANLLAIVQDELADAYELEVVDVLERPQEAEDERIVATPTLLKQLPPPRRRVVGDLGDRQQVLLGLDLA